MSKLMRNKTLAGNISLVVFLAFLFTMSFGMALAPQDAYAAYNYKTNQTIPSNGPPTITGNYTTTSTGMTVQLGPLSGVDFALDDIYLSTSNTLAGQIGQMTYQSVYANVYTLVYTGQMVYDEVYLLVYNSSGLYASVILDVRDPVPDGGGGGGGGGTPSQTTTTTDTGTVTSTATSTTLTVDTAAVETAITNPEVKEVQIMIPQDLAKTENTVAVPAATLQQAFEANKPVVVAAAGVELEVPVQAMDLKAMAEDGATVSFVISKVDNPAEAAGPNTYRVLGNVFKIEIQVTKDGQSKGVIETFSQPLTLTIPYSGVDLQGVSEDRLGISRYNEATGQWDNLGGTVDTVNKVISVPRNSLSLYALTERPVKSFEDITTHWARAEIEYMAGKGIVNGVTANSFAPNRMITRAEFATLAVKSLGLADDKAAAGKFKDVAAAGWFAGTVGAAVKAGLVSGYPDGTFKPGNNITREEMAAVITKAMALGIMTEQEISGQLSSFRDAGNISNWAKAAVAGAVKNGIVKGRTDGNFDAKANATRAEAVVMLKKMLDYTGK